MSSHSREPLTPEERELAARLSRLGAHAAPSPALDARILAAAHAATAGASRRARRPRWPVALGAVATLVLAIGVAWQLRPAQEKTTRAWSEAPASAPAAAETAQRRPGAGAAGEPPAAAVEDAAPLPAMAPQQPRAMRRLPQAPPDATDERGADAASARAASSTDVDEREPAAFRRIGEASAPPAADASHERTARQEGSGQDADASTHDASRQDGSTQRISAKRAFQEQESAPGGQPSRKQKSVRFTAPVAPPAPPPPPAEVVFDVAPAPAPPAPAAASTRERAVQSLPVRARQGEAKPATSTPASAPAPAPKPKPTTPDRPEPTGTRIERDNAGFTDQALDDQPPATADSPDVQRAWLQRIRELLARGNTEGARTSLAEFKRRYPRYALPVDLRELAPSPAPAPAPAP